MIDNLPNGWRIEELGKCIDILDNQRIPLNNQDREERIKGKDITELYPYYGATQQVGYIDNFIFNEELVLLGEDGVMFYDKDKPKAYLISGKSWVNNHAHVLRAKKDITINKYLLNFLNTFHYKGFVSGATRLKLNQSRMAKIPIPIPPLQQQERIVRVLDLSSNLIEKQKELLKNYDLFLKSKFIEMFGDPITNPIGWETIEFGKIIEILTDYHANGSYQILKKHVELLDKKDYALMIRTTDLENNNFLNNVKYITEDAYHFLKKTKVYGNEIIMNKIGSAGSIFLMPNLNKPVSLGMNLFLIRLKKIANEIFIFNLLESEYGKKSIEKKVRGAVTKSITKDAVREINIILPPIELQNKFASIVEKIEIIKEKENQKLKQLENLHNSLMQKAFKGEL